MKADTQETCGITTFSVSRDTVTRHWYWHTNHEHAAHESDEVIPDDHCVVSTADFGFVGRQKSF